MFELGLTSFAEAPPEPVGGKVITHGERLRNVVAEIEKADQVGLDVYGLGEHHRIDMAASAPAITLAAAAARTERIRLSSAVIVLSSADPVRTFQDFSTLDLISSGRAELLVGRGSFIESFPLFGYDLGDYNELFAEKLALLLEIREAEQVTWSGKHRSALEGQGIYPRPVQDPLPVWVAVGGTPQSVVRAATLGLPMALAIIGGMPEQFGPMVDLYRRTWQEAGHDPSDLQLSVNSHGFITDERQQAMDEAFPPFELVMNKIGRERGWPPMSRGQFDASCSLRGANFIGSPDDVIEKILYQHELFDHQRFLLQLSVGTMEHAKVMHAIELLGTQVAPVVRSEIARRTANTTG